MSDLNVRQLSYDFEGIDFVWNPQNPAFSYLANVISFQTIGFEKFICKTVHEVLPLIENHMLRAEAEDFAKQEMMHSKGHMAHVRGLIGRYPDLQDVFNESVRDFEAKWAAHSTEYRLAYSAIVEGTSLPLYKIIIRHRERLVLPGDARVASLLLWHFCEEIEHRSSALKLYNALVGKPFYRLRVFPDVGQHLAANMMRIADRFSRIVPEAAGIDMRQAMADVPRLDRARMTASLFASQLPFYNPSRGSVPDYCSIWQERYEAGADMTSKTVLS